MEFFFPDSQDQVSPTFDFCTEEHAMHRVRQRDDLYAHEALAAAPYDGLLISKAIVDGSARSAGKYTMAQRQRVYRLGAHRFFRADHHGTRLPIMGDCGAFAYANEPEPPYTVDEVIDFYEGIGLDRGVSVDHIVFGYLNATKRNKGAEPEDDWRRRRDLTIQLGAEFLAAAKSRKTLFEPVGVAHGWDPESYQRSVKELQAQGYGRIAVGGLVPLKTKDLVEVVAAISDVRDTATQFHLLGVTRTEHIPDFASQGVTSFDSTSPFRQAFMDDRDNYYTPERTYIALRVPQVDGNPTLKSRIRAGEVDQRAALVAERECLDLLRAFDRDDAGVDEVVAALRAYEVLHDTKGQDRTDLYRETLEAAPWRQCRCGICDTVGIEVIVFRGSERNKRRGFHNLTVFRKELDAQIAIGRGR
jgi:hypothetical protein